jgi:ABC-type nitrate/sulfonate/bicarbonate transport system substrate-binding protein
MASVMKFDEKYGIKIIPSKESSWAAVRDKLVNGELDATSPATHAGDFTGLDLARSTPAAGHGVGNQGDARSGGHGWL